MEKKFIVVSDFDGVLGDTSPLIEDEILRIRFEASSAYARKLLLEHKEKEEQIFRDYGQVDSELCEKLIQKEEAEYLKKRKLYHIAKDEVLEEVFDKYKDKIDYRKIYRRENLFPEVINFINSKFLASENVKKLYIATHYNADSEKMQKQLLIRQELPEAEAIFIPFHDIPYVQTDNKELYLKNGDRIRTNKAREFKRITGEDLAHAVFVDDIFGICEEAIAEGAKAYWRDPLSDNPTKAFEMAYNYIMGPTQHEKEYQKLLSRYGM